MNRRTLRRLAQVATAASAALILYLTLSPAPPRLGTVPHFTTARDTPAAAARPPVWTDDEEDAAGHATLFAVMGAAAALWYATSDRASRSPRRTLLMVMLALWLFGGMTEVAQGLFTTTRTPQLSDLAFDVLGAFTGFLGGSAVLRLLFSRIAR